MNLVDLVQLIVPWEQREERQHLKEDAAYTPDVHFVSIVAVSHEAFRCTVPAS